MNRFKKTASIKTVSLAFSIFTLLAYHFPVFNYAANNVEGGLNGVLIMGGAQMPKRNIPKADRPQGTVKHTEKQLGRNALCSCGSGKKYKNCCGRS